MKRLIFVLYDTLLCDTLMTLEDQSEAAVKRQIKSALISSRPNPINTDTKEKDIYLIGELDTETKKLVAFEQPKFVVHVEEVRLDLLQELSSEEGFLEQYMEGLKAAKTEVKKGKVFDGRK